MSKTGTIVQLAHVKELPSKDPAKYGPSQIWRLTLDNGDTGEAMYFQSDPAPTVGKPITYDIVQADRPEWSNKIVLVREKKQQGGSRGTAWTPEKENSVMIQGLLKSIIETTATPDQWPELLSKALALHDKALKARLERLAGPVQNGAPAQATVTNDKPAAYRKPAPIADVPDPFV